MEMDVLRDRLQGLRFPEGAGYAVLPDLYDLAKRVDTNAPDALQFAHLALRFAEQHPEEEFGNPGPLVRTVERIDGYEELLLESLQRRPSLVAIRLAYRIVNTAEHGSRSALLQAVRAVAVREDAPPRVREDAATFLAEVG